MSPRSSASSCTCWRPAPGCRSRSTTTCSGWRRSPSSSTLASTWRSSTTRPTRPVSPAAAHPRYPSRSRASSRARARGTGRTSAAMSSSIRCTLARRSAEPSMTLFLQNDAGGSGTGGVFADRGFGHLIQIANMDAGIGQNAPVGDLIQITYNKTLTGTTLDRLNTPVNTDFSGVSGSTDIIVVPVDETFVRPNGTFVTENAGLTFPDGHSENPTSSVLIVYDTSDNGGSGYCLPREGGGTTSFPGSVILYHELSHALRM